MRTVLVSIGLLLILSAQGNAQGHRCLTCQPNCAGESRYVNPEGRPLSVTVEYAHGGHTNFVLEPFGRHTVQMRTGDKDASAWGSSGVPANVPRRACVPIW